MADLHELVTGCYRQTYPIQPDGWSAGAAVSSAGERRGDSLDSRHDPRPDEPDSLGWFFRRASNPGTSLPLHRSTATPTRHPCWATWPGAIRQPLPHRHTCGPARPGCATGRARARAAVADEFRRRLVGRTDRNFLAGRAAARRRHSRQTRRSMAARTAGASAGRFHHAQSQVHRFLKLLGGYTFSATLVQPWRHRRHHAARGRHPR